jgi:hypothetical protein
MVENGQRYRRSDGTVVEVVTVAGIEVDCEVVESPTGRFEEGARFGVTPPELEREYERVTDVTTDAVDRRESDDTDSVPSA